MRHCRNGMGAVFLRSLLEKERFGWVTLLLYMTQSLEWVFCLGLCCWRQYYNPTSTFYLAKYFAPTILSPSSLLCLYTT